MVDCINAVERDFAKGWDMRGRYTITVPKGEQPREPWLELIYAANRIESKFFGEPAFVGRVEGEGFFGSAEEYLHVRILFPDDEPGIVRFVAMSEHGEAVLRAARAAVL